MIEQFGDSAKLFLGCIHAASSLFRIVGASPCNSVFVTKYHLHVVAGAMLDNTRSILSVVCTDFAEDLIEMDGEDDHVHLLVNYPSELAVSSLVNSLKVVSRRKLQQKHQELVRGYRKDILWRPLYFSESCGGETFSNIRQYIEPRRTPD